jgi:HPr kinase/phosphorylase
MPGAARDPLQSDLTLHASCVAVAEKALLIRGASGCGKSTLALQMMGLGAVLVSDDRVILHRRGDAVLARAPDAIRGMIECRGLGLLNAHPVQDVPVAGVVDLDQSETERLPPNRETVLSGCRLNLFHRIEGAHFAAALVQWLKAGRRTV